MSRDQIDSDWIYRLTYITVYININNRILGQYCNDAISLTFYEKRETSNEVTSQFFSHPHAFMLFVNVLHNMNEMDWSIEVCNSQATSTNITFFIY